MSRPGPFDVCDEIDADCVEVRGHDGNEKLRRGKRAGLARSFEVCEGRTANELEVLAFAHAVDGRTAMQDAAPTHHARPDRSGMRGIGSRERMRSRRDM